MLFILRYRLTSRVENVIHYGGSLEFHFNQAGDVEYLYLNDTDYTQHGPVLDAMLDLVGRERIQARLSELASNPLVASVTEQILITREEV